MAAPGAPVSRDEQLLRLASEDDQAIERLLPVLDDALDALESAGVDYLLMGGIASACLGRDRWTHDIDLLTRPGEAHRLLQVLAKRGFDTEETYPEWLFKAQKDGQLVDIIFRSAGDISLDEDMLARPAAVTFMGRRLRTVPAEDLVVIKALVAAEHTPRHWYDGLAILATAEMDWGYLIRRAARGIRRVTSMLLYAQSNDLPVPHWVIQELFDRLDGRRTGV